MNTFGDAEPNQTCLLFIFFVLFF